MNLAKAKKIISTGYWSDFYIYPIAVLVFLVYGLYAINFKIGLAFILFIIGLVLGSFLEYFIHRVIFHHCPGFKTLHQLHHDRPIDLIGSPTYVSIPVYVTTVFIPLVLMSNIAYASIIFSAFLLDLLFYFIIHHTTHHVRSKKGSILHWYKKYHAVHHTNPDVNFSVAFPIWDIVFRTRQRN
ncbi:fatty acid hydroxylase [Candidatus Francisella endociliophora]|uniref:Fatty acid hydroxylase n=1 Tax=Candidatus Francisella endociliophora TaxID=653937 RepID=A0A097EMF6_9GAMM|nr:sterol desaturase family protein [Francisella sp. FSC1006]AIT08752.1 fatty acid hydroxylase [Francisella sp. FSC1006]